MTQILSSHRHVCIKSEMLNQKSYYKGVYTRHTVQRSAFLLSKESRAHAQYSSYRADVSYTLCMRRKRLCLLPTYNLLPPLAPVVWLSATLVTVRHFIVWPNSSERLH